MRQLRRQQRDERDTKIRRLISEGNGIRGTARKAGVDVKTVRRLVRPKGKPEKRKSKLDPFRPYITKLVCQDEFTAVLVLKELRGLGYQGGYGILKDFVRLIRPKSVRRPHLRFETAPGEQGQVDLSPYELLLGGVATDVVCFSFVLGFSRWQFIYFFLHADAHAVCYGHVLAFEKAGGVPEEILYDRMKQVVLESYRHRVVMHPLFDAMRLHYGAFRAVPLAPGYKEGKGKVENPFRYIEGHFLCEHRRSFRSMDDLNEKAAVWLRDTAWPRKHGTTRERPIDRLDLERQHLKPLPFARFEAAEIVECSVGDDFCVPWETNRYSVRPRFVGLTAKLRVLDQRLEVSVGGEAVIHTVRNTRYKRYILPEHEAEFRERSTSRHVLSEQFLGIGPSARDFQDGLIAEHRGAAGYHMSRILGLAGRVGAPRIAEALRHAVRYGAFDYNAVARIVEGKTDMPIVAPLLTGPLPERIHEYLRGVGEHQRPLRTYEQMLRKLKGGPDDGE
ncbi:MAG TPA: IS21 family transposase [Burkholderiales bacterium]|nr:IS21 family transposase [Burkholderiales bacterium]